MQLQVAAVILVLVQIAIANFNATTTNATTAANLVATKKISNETDNAKGMSLTQVIELNTNNTRRKCKTIKKKKKKERSTSSSSGEKDEDADGGGNAESLDLSGSSLESEKSTQQLPNPNATGWRRWHRVCTPCIEDMMRKWRDPSISWVCGAYQRARRSFKSECMMHYRNCQDGTMFTKIHEHRCSDADIPVHGKHFFYDYKVQLSEDSSSSGKSKGNTESSESSESRSSASFEDIIFRRDTKAKKEILKKGKKVQISKKMRKKVKRSEKKTITAKGDV